MARQKGLLLVALLGLPVLAPAAEERIADWDFLQALGGIKIEAVEAHPEQGWTLPVVCDLTGIRRITTLPTAMNSTLVVDDIVWQRQGGSINLAIQLREASYAGREARCHGVDLPETLPPGAYDVYYRQADGERFLLGEAELTP